MTYSWCATRGCMSVSNMGACRSVVLYLLLATTLLQVSAHPYRSNNSDKNVDQKDVAITKKTTSLTGRFLDILLKPLRKVWRTYFVRTVFPTVMGVKLLVLVPTLAIVMTLLEGAVATAVFFYILFTTAVAGKPTNYIPSKAPSFPWSLVDKLVDNPDDLKTVLPTPMTMSNAPGTTDSYIAAHMGSWADGGPYNYQKTPTPPQAAASVPNQFLMSYFYPYSSHASAGKTTPSTTQASLMKNASKNNIHS